MRGCGPVESSIFNVGSQWYIFFAYLTWEISKARASCSNSNKHNAVMIQLHELFDKDVAIISKVKHVLVGPSSFLTTGRVVDWICASFLLWPHSISRHPVGTTFFILYLFLNWMLFIINLPIVWPKNPKFKLLSKKIK